MSSPSVWASTMTFFPLLRERLLKLNHPGEACVVGAADGKFVLPLAADGWKVIAIERDPVAVHGGEVMYPDGPGTMPGLLARAYQDGLEPKITIMDRDFRNLDLPLQCAVVFTSCSWHYSLNHNTPLEQFVCSMQEAVSRGGIFCAEYMMPVEDRHVAIEHYLEEGQLAKYFPATDWNIRLQFYTDTFLELAHVGNLTDHWHRMGFILAERK